MTFNGMTLNILYTVLYQKILKILNLIILLKFYILQYVHKLYHKKKRYFIIQYIKKLDLIN